MARSARFSAQRVRGGCHQHGQQHGVALHRSVETGRYVATFGLGVFMPYMIHPEEEGRGAGFALH